MLLICPGIGECYRPTRECYRFAREYYGSGREFWESGTGRSRESENARKNWWLIINLNRSGECWNNLVLLDDLKSENNLGIKYN